MLSARSAALAASLAALAAPFATSGARASGLPARGADLIDDAERLTRIWSRSEAAPSPAPLIAPRVQRLPPVFAEHGHTAVIRLPAPSASPAAFGCTTVVFLAPRTAEFTVDTEVVPPEQDAIEQLLRQIHGAGAERRIRSVAGAARIDRCGPERDALRFAILELTSPRAAVEVIIAESVAPPGPLEEVFPERVFGPLAPRGDPGRPIEPGPIAERVARAERRARGDGAARVVRAEMRASQEGTGEFTLRLPEGCHRIELMAEVPTVLPRRATDVDAEARDADTGRPLDRDRGDAADARLFACVGETTTVEVPYMGASGPVRVVLSDAIWPIPQAAPASYGARARAGFAAALLRRHAPVPVGPPIAESVGVSGDTLVPVALEPGRCYFAAASVLRGDARVLRLGVEIGDRALRDDGPRSDSVGVAFCAEAEERAALRVAARGASAWWALAVWPMD